MPRKNYKPPARSRRCGCLLRCNYYMLRCDSCHRGVHFVCLKLSDPAADLPKVYVCGTCKKNGVEEPRVAEIRAAEGRPCAVIFQATCQYGGCLPAPKALPVSNEHSDETIKCSWCDICHETCMIFNVACDNCDVFWHACCIPLTRQQTERIDKWYCERCRKKDARLQVSFKHGHDTEETGKATATPLPRLSSVPSATVTTEQRQKRRTTTTEITIRPTKRTAQKHGATEIHAEPQTDAADVQSEQPPPAKVSGNANKTVEEHVAVVEDPSAETLSKQLKQADDRTKNLEQEVTTLQETLEETKAEAVAERAIRIAAEEELTKKNVLIAHLTAKLVDAGQL